MRTSVKYMIDILRIKFSSILNNNTCNDKKCLVLP